MKIILERHKFAPELNKAYIGPNKVMIPVPNLVSIAEVRDKYFKPLRHVGNYVTLRVWYADRPDYARTGAGFILHMRHLAAVQRAFKKRHNLPGGKFTTSIKLIG